MACAFKLSILSVALVVLCLVSSIRARADTIAFSFTEAGTATLTSMPPLADFQVAATGQFAPFGAHTLSVMGMVDFGVVDPNGSNPATGTFTFDFGSGNSFFGALTQEFFPPNPQTGLVTFNINYTITGGTGIFTSASGAASSMGSGFFTSPIDVSFNESGSGRITAQELTAIPEPSTVLLLGTGLAGVGAAVRKRRQVRSKEP